MSKGNNKSVEVSPEQWRKKVQGVAPAQLEQTDPAGKAFDAFTYPLFCQHLRRAAQVIRQIIVHQPVPIYVLERFPRSMAQDAFGAAGLACVLLSYRSINSSGHEHRNRALNGWDNIYCVTLQALLHEVVHFCTFRELEHLQAALAVRRRLGTRLPQIFKLFRACLDVVDSSLAATVAPRRKDEFLEAVELVAEAGALLLFPTVIAAAPGPLGAEAQQQVIAQAQIGRIPSLAELYGITAWILKLQPPDRIINALVAEGEDVVAPFMFHPCRLRKAMLAL